MARARPLALDARRLVPVIVLLLAAAALVLARGDDRAPEKGDEEVFLQAAYLMRTDDVTAIEAITRAAGNEYGWTGDIAERLRDEGDIQTYALLHLWRHAPDFETGPSPWDSPLYVESRLVSSLSHLAFLATVGLLYWAVLPLGRGVALASALLLALGHPYREGPAMFDPWVMPAVAAAIGCWLRDRHLAASALATVAVLVKPNYLFLLPAFALATLVRPGRGDAPGRASFRLVAVPAAAVVFIVASYLVFGALDVIYLDGYFDGVRSGYDPGVLAFSLLETASFTYRAANQQLRDHWPVFPWTVVNIAALGVLGHRALRRARMPRTATLLGGLILIPAIANFTVIASVDDYMAGGHFRWINVSLMGMAIALPVAWREVVRVAAARVQVPVPRAGPVAVGSHLPAP